MTSAPNKNEATSENRRCAMHGKRRGCIVRLVVALAFAASMFMLCRPLPDETRYEHIIRNLHTHGTMPSDVRLEGVFLTHAMRENRYVFTGVATNMSFLTEAGRHDGKTNYWPKAASDGEAIHYKITDYWFCVSHEKFVEPVSKEKFYVPKNDWNQGESKFFNAMMTMAKVPFECTKDTLVFCYQLESTFYYLWLAVDGDKFYLLVQTGV